ncbi:MAG TPA: BglII/BstYI family type II restriction endonuclease [Woeseiaceae bacterium]|nr:BglII/BstYI family type II restriction endonuclease [Woeseiaceae bacterium]
MNWESHLPQDIRDLYEVHETRHAAAILVREFPDLSNEVFEALRQFRFSGRDARMPGGSESIIPKKFSRILRPLGWREGKLKAKLVLEEQVDGETLDRDISFDTHKVDYLKGRVAFDLEWNSKDQTFDRDLAAFRTFFDYDKISVGILVTRSSTLESWFKNLGFCLDKDGAETDSPVYKKYGASTTHMNKLLPRLEAGRGGGCPILALGITRRLVTDE